MRDGADGGETLRERAERLTSVKEYGQPELLPPEEMRAALHELHVHQIELEMQNEELRRAQSEIEDARARYFDLYDMAPVGYCTLSDKGIILEANLTAAGLFGAARGELIGKPFTLYIVKDDQDVYYLNKLRLFEEREPRSFELRMQRNGALFWANINATILRGENGENVCRITLSDITERRRAEEALRASEEELRQADKNKDEFLGTLSHELRNPLAVISAGIQLLDIAADANQINMAKKTLNRQLNQLCRLVDDLLDLTRITKNKMVLKKEKTELNALALTTAEDHSLLFKNKEIALKLDVGDKAIYLDADPVRVKQIVGNLLHNALKFTQAGGETRLRVYSEYGDAVISVTDNGIGISPDVIPRLFQPFVQTFMPIDRSGGGLGLGLAITKGIAELHGGSVGAQSGGPGKGTEFIVRLPTQITEGRQKTVADIAKQDKNSVRSLKILIIEDNADFAVLLGAMITTMGYGAYTAYDGSAGIEQAKITKPDIIICDIGLPGMDGFEVAESIRKDTELKETYMIALTGYAGEDDVYKAISAGYDRHMAKPVSLTELQKALSEAAGF